MKMKMKKKLTPNCILFILFIISLLFYSLYHFFLMDTYFCNFMYKLGIILSNLSIGFISACIFYLLTIVFMEKRKKSKKLLLIFKSLDEIKVQMSLFIFDIIDRDLLINNSSILNNEDAYLLINSIWKIDTQHRKAISRKFSSIKMGYTNNNGVSEKGKTYLEVFYIYINKIEVLVSEINKYIEIYSEEKIFDILQQITKSTLHNLVINTILFTNEYPSFKSEPNYNFEFSFNITSIFNYHKKHFTKNYIDLYYELDKITIEINKALERSDKLL